MQRKSKWCPCLVSAVLTGILLSVLLIEWLSRVVVRCWVEPVAQSAQSAPALCGPEVLVGRFPRPYVSPETEGTPDDDKGWHPCVFLPINFQPLLLDF